MSRDRRISHIEDQLNQSRELHSEVSNKPPWLAAFDALPVAERIAILERNAREAWEAMPAKERKEQELLAARFGELSVAEQVALLQSEILMEEFRRRVPV